MCRIVAIIKGTSTLVGIPTVLITLMDVRGANEVSLMDQPIPTELEVAEVGIDYYQDPVRHRDPHPSHGAHTRGGIVKAILVTLVILAGIAVSLPFIQPGPTCSRPKMSFSFGQELSVKSDLGNSSVPDHLNCTGGSIASGTKVRFLQPANYNCTPSVSSTISPKHYIQHDTFTDALVLILDGQAEGTQAQIDDYDLVTK